MSELLSAFTLERGGPDPLFRQLYAQVRDAILRGTLGAGMQLPPTRELCLSCWACRARPSSMPGTS
ncbi:GntR family transcriptional regulator [Massilia sp. B-10]|nr:GntR family transcriptional regulator [Massilia sp. B-10]